MNTNEQKYYDEVVNICDYLGISFDGLVVKELHHKLSVSGTIRNTNGNIRKLPKVRKSDNLKKLLVRALVNEMPDKI
jgi:hypothetical protein